MDEDCNVKAWKLEPYCSIFDWVSTLIFIPRNRESKYRTDTNHEKIQKDPIMDTSETDYHFPFSAS